MARIPEHEIERIKQEVSVQRLAEARGIKLEPPRGGPDRAVPFSRPIASRRSSSRRRRTCGIAWEPAGPAGR